MMGGSPAAMQQDGLRQSTTQCTVGFGREERVGIDEKGGIKSNLPQHLCKK